MNERIAKLYDQAIVLEDGGDFVTGELDPAKFAELIVRECATAITDDQLAKDCDTLMMQSWAKGMRYSAEVIKEHFGVEE